jgi:C1A family cysteine protease
MSDAEQLVAASAVPFMLAPLARQLGLRTQDLEKVLAEARAQLPARLLAELSEPAESDRGLGALFPAADQLREALAVPVADESEYRDLPPCVNWANELPAVQNQGLRGTSVAFALTALNEFYWYVQGQSVDLSEQHLYFEAKATDGAADACGTWQACAVNVLGIKGQCTEGLWSYNPTYPCNMTEPKPLDADDEATSYQMEPNILNPQDVNGMKVALAAHAIVTVSIPVFSSWYHSAETMRSGRITMPIGNEAPIGGHAVCLVGYQDDPQSPGGGRFIVRNSWGTFWGAHCPYGAGNGTIPYKYLAKHGTEAYTL